MPISNGTLESTISSASFIKNRFFSNLLNENFNKLLFIYRGYIS